MKYYIYVLALCLLSIMALASPHVAASSSSVEMPVASSFQVSSLAKATDSIAGDFSIGPGRVEITRDDHGMNIRLTGLPGNGSRLISLDDYESGIAFRNNTFLLPLYAGGGKSGELILATDNLIADSYGYTGIITGLQLDSGKITTERDGQNITAGVLITLTDLSDGSAYRFAFIDNTSLAEAILAVLEASGEAPAVETPPVEITADSATAGNAISFVIVTIEISGNRTAPYIDKNLTFYRYADGELSHLRFSADRSGSDRLVFQAIAPGPGQFQVVAPAPRGPAKENVSTGSLDVLLLGGLLAGLVIALTVMVRRVTRR